MAKEFKGRSAKPKGPDAELLNLPPSTQFYYRWHPARVQVVQVDGEDWYVPILGKKQIDPGVGGVDSHGNWDTGKLAEQKGGWTFLPWEVIPESSPGADDGGYCIEYDGVAGPVYLERCQSVRQVGKRVIVKTDTDAYQRWLVSLVVDGHVRLDPDLMEMQQEQLQRRIDRNAGKADARKKAAFETDAAKMVSAKRAAYRSELTGYTVAQLRDLADADDVKLAKGAKKPAIVTALFDAKFPAPAEVEDPPKPPVGE